LKVLRPGRKMEEKEMKNHLIGFVAAIAEK
jgi:hypothetical protein